MKHCFRTVEPCQNTRTWNLHSWMKICLNFFTSVIWSDFLSSHFYRKYFFYSSSMITCSHHRQYLLHQKMKVNRPIQYDNQIKKDRNFKYVLSIGILRVKLQIWNIETSGVVNVRNFTAQILLHAMYKLSQLKLKEYRRLRWWKWLQRYSNKIKITCSTSKYFTKKNVDT